MKCYLIRHADAVSLGEGGIVDDASRPLTPTGEKQCQLVGQGLARRGIRLDVLLTSPLLRARETAAAVARHLPAPAPEVRDCPQLAPGGKRRKLAREIESAGKETVGLVGHQPDLGEFAAWLIGSKKAQIDLAKASVACIDFEEAIGKGEGKLLWIVTPEWLER
jgi:phosphohistidine phosphatase